jgi:hypothetical protein
VINLPEGFSELTLLLLQDVSLYSTSQKEQNMFLQSFYNPKGRSEQASTTHAVFIYFMQCA